MPRMFLLCRNPIRRAIRTWIFFPINFNLLNGCIGPSTNSQ